MLFAFFPGLEIDLNTTNYLQSSSTLQAGDKYCVSHGIAWAGIWACAPKSEDVKKSKLGSGPTGRVQNNSVCVTITTWPLGITLLSQRMDWQVLGQCSCNPSRLTERN